MKVLLLGDFSSLHKNLKEGLEQNGVNVTLISNGDSWKKIEGADDVLFENKGNFFRRKYGLYIEPFSKAMKYKGYDVVQIINPCIYSSVINSKVLSIIKKNNGLLSMVAAGYDTKLYKKYKDGFFDYYSLDDADAAQDFYDASNIKGRFHQWNDINVEKKVDIVVPSAYEYSVGYINSGKVSDVTPFPINIDSIEYSNNNVGDKIVFFHGLNREIEKGTYYIKEALNRLKQQYPNDVEVIIDGHLPFDEYSRIVNRANVIIDQCKSYGYGMNACISMASGKVVLSGRRKEHLDSLGIKECPVFEIKPNVEQIYGQLEYIVKNKHMIPEIGKKSREYVEVVHNYKNVAKKYIDIWKKVER